jgi:sulfur carrier protein
MEITLNGEKRLYKGPATLPGLLESLGVRPGTVVVEINFRIVPRESLSKETIREGDAIEVIRLVGGG